MENTKRSSKFKSVIIGSLLGDGCIETPKNMNYSEQHTEKQREYLEWKKNILCPERTLTLINRSFGKVYRLRFYDINILKPLRQDWYPNGKKIVPKSILNYLDELAMTVWFLDDGDIMKGNTARISSMGFTYKEHKLLIRAMHKNLNLQPYIIKEGKYRRLYFSSRTKAFDRLMEIVGKTLIEYNFPDSIRYKFRERLESKQGKAKISKKRLTQDAKGRFISLRCAPTSIVK